MKFNRVLALPSLPLLLLAGRSDGGSDMSIHLCVLRRRQQGRKQGRRPRSGFVHDRLGIRSPSFHRIVGALEKQALAMASHLRLTCEHLFTR